MTQDTKVCSNHFVHGKPLGDHPHPELWLLGYSGKETSNINVSETISKLNEHNNEQNEDIFVRTRKGFIKRKAEAKTQKRSFKQQRLEDRPPNNQDQLQSEDT